MSERRGEKQRIYTEREEKTHYKRNDLYYGIFNRIIMKS